MNNDSYNVTSSNSSSSNANANSSATANAPLVVNSTNYNFQNMSAGGAPSSTSAMTQNVLKNAANPLLAAAAAGGAFASNSAKDSLLQHMATSFMAASSSNAANRRVPEVPLAMDLFERRNSLAQTTTASSVTAFPNSTTSLNATAAANLNAAASASALSASNMLNGYSSEDIFEPVPLNNAAALMGVFNPSATNGQLGQQDNALARMLSMALDEITTGFDSDLSTNHNPRSSMDPFQQQRQQQQQAQQQQQFLSQNSFLQASNANKRTMPQAAAAAATTETPNKRARTSLNEEDDKSPRFRPYQEKQWVEQFDELLKFKAQNGHCLVPHTFDENPTLSRWVKRQRYQYKLKQESKQSTMTDARIVKLENVGFVWDSHAAAWEERLNELNAYKNEYGDCNVPSNYPKNPQLATWVKCQRRQCKLFWCGKTSNMTLERFASLNQLGFTWELRSGSSSKKLAAQAAMGNLPF